MDATELERELARVLALEVIEVAAELKLANSEERDEAAEPVAVERTDWMLD